jgi:hypothetical protein
MVTKAKPGFFQNPNLVGIERSRMVKTKTKLPAIDRDALTRARELVKARGEPRRRVRRDWFDEATSAAYSCQCRVLGLKPWHPPPMYGHIPMHDNEHAEAAAHSLQPARLLVSFNSLRGIYDSEDRWR